MMNLEEEVLQCLYDNILEGRLLETERLLSVSEVNPNKLIKDKGISLLHLTAGIEPEDYAEQVVEIILKHGGNPNTFSEEGMTALHVGAAWGKVNIVKMLLSAGGDPYLADMDGKTPLDYATEQRNQDVLQCLIEDMNIGGSYSSPRKYSFKLDKVLISNGIIEGEYYPEDILNIEPIKKFDYINEWFAKSPKLENSLRCHSNGTDSNKTPTNSVKNFSSSSSEMVTANNFSNESSKTTITRITGNYKSVEIPPKNSTLYESCVSSYKSDKRNDANIYDSSLLTSDASFVNEKKINDKNNSLMSGVEPIDVTHNNLTNFSKPINEHDQKKFEEKLLEKNEELQWGEMYMGVTLKPHQNYEFRTNIKTCQILDYYRNEEQNVECSTLLSTHWSDQTCDLEADCSSSECTQQSDYMNKALVKTNTSLGSIQTINSTVKSDKSAASKFNNGFINRTGRGKLINSSISSSKNGSFVNDTVPSVAEEYKYQDEEAGVALIEKRILVNTPIVINSSANQSGVLSTISSVASSLPMSLNYDTDILKRELKSFGVTPGPITKTTKRVYLRRLHNMKKNPNIITHTLTKTTTKTYSIELEKTFRDASWNANLSSYIELERKLIEQFDIPNPKKKWREGIIKSSFTYLLLDPRISDNLPCRADTMQPADVWKIFIDSIFYIGKGKRSRPYSHLYEAVTLHNTEQTKIDNDKVQMILNIWKDKCGVVCLHIFQNVIPVEAYTREAAMIDVIGLKNLKNIKPGNYYGCVATWPLKQKKLLGVYLLYRAMLIFLNEGERQLRPMDIK